MSATDDHSKKVCYTDRDRFSGMCAAVSSSMDGIVRKLAPVGEDHDDFVFRFQEKFLQAMKANSRYAGQASSSLGTTALSKVKDDGGKDTEEEEEESYLQAVLMPQWDALAVEVAKKRSTYPTACRKLLRANLKAGRRQLVLKHRAAKKSQVTPRPVSSSLADGAVACKELASSVAADLSGFLTESNLLLAKFERLKVSREMMSSATNAPSLKYK